MVFKHTVIWSEEAVRNLEGILEYLYSEWTQREVDNFKRLLSKQLLLISNHPLMFPISKFQPRLRKAVLMSKIIVFYEFKEKSIFLVYLFHTSQNPDKIE